LILLAFCLGIINIYLQYKRWHIITRVAFHINDKKVALKSLLIGLSGGVITPMRIGEIVGRNMLYPKVDIFTLGFASYIDKLFPLVLTLIVGFISANIFINMHYNLPDYINFIADTIYILILMFLITLIFNKKLFKYVIHKISYFSKFHNIINNTKYFKSVRVKTILWILFLTILYYICLISQYAILVMAFSHVYNIFDFMFVGTILFFVLSISSPLTISGLGVREITSIYILSKFNISNEAAFNASVYLFIINILLPAIVGLVLFLNHKRDANV